MYVRDIRQNETIQSEISGRFVKLSDEGSVKVCLVTSEADCLTVGELINAFGFTVDSILGRKLVISIEDETEQVIQEGRATACSLCGSEQETKITCLGCGTSVTTPAP